MNPDTPTINEPYLAYADLLLKHFHLLSDGKDESAELDQVEEEMSRLWEKLDEPQRRSLSGIGSDLNSVRSGGQPPPRARSSAEVSRLDQSELQALQASEEWHCVLVHLRDCASSIPTTMLAATRAHCYRQLRLEELAAVFDDFAAELHVETAGRIPVGH